MNHVLLLEAGPHGRDSLGARLAFEVVAQLQARHPKAGITYRSLAEAPLPPLSSDYARALVGRRPNANPEFTWSERLIAEVERSDFILISTPMHNFTVPAALKLWIDHVLRIGRTFHSTPAGKVGLLDNRPTLVLVRSGGACTGEAARQPDFLAPYLTQVLAVIGIRTVMFHYLPGVTPDADALAEVRRELTASPVFVPLIGEPA